MDKAGKRDGNGADCVRYRGVDPEIFCIIINIQGKLSSGICYDVEEKMFLPLKNAPD